MEKISPEIARKAQEKRREIESLYAKDTDFKTGRNPEVFKVIKNFCETKVQVPAEKRAQKVTPLHWPQYRGYLSPDQWIELHTILVREELLQVDKK